MDVLVRIKRLVLAGAIRYTDKALHEMAANDLVPRDIVESIVSARRIAKTLRSSTAHGGRRGEKLYVIESPNFSGTPVYTKGKIDQAGGRECFYVLISAKTSTRN